jgi:glycosyltransferase involved in cell wall biosynthesis
MKKYKILMLSDHALSTSGVGCQSRFLINGLLEKGCWSVRQFGAALKHDNYDAVHVSDDFIIKPIDGFGNPDMLRIALATERPDVLLLFTDPRFFTWLWEMEDEVHQICPIAYWHVWDNRPRPAFNDKYYAATDLINCHSHPTYELVKEKFPERVNFIPHALPTDVFFPLPVAEKKRWRQEILGYHKKDDFVALWVNRNAKRKRPADVLWAWSIFLEKYNITDATLLMHTDPYDSEGPHLIAVADMLGIQDSVLFSPERVDFEKMNILHNASDCCINIAYAEGFGLPTLEAMQVGNPIVAVKTGGLTRQVVDHRDGTENGVALDVTHRTLVGSQNVPFIYEDYADVNAVAEGLYKLYSMDADQREALSKKCRSYALEEFNLETTVDKWHNTLSGLVEDWKAGNRPTPRFEMIEIGA